MRMRRTGDKASHVADLLRREIEEMGEEFTVSRPSDGSTRRVKFIVNDLPVTTETARIEATLNTEFTMAHEFRCAGGADVRENDTLVLGGFVLRLQGHGVSMRGIEIGMVFLGVRVARAA